MQIKRFLKGAHEYAGTLDDKDQWIPKDQFNVPGTFYGAPLNYIKHLYTVKYARRLYEHNPKLYHWLHQVTKPMMFCLIKGIDPKSDDGKKIIAESVAYRMTKRIGIK